jgi:ParB family chromosome partitioning protein
MKIPIEKIIVKKRIRKEYGDIHALAESMKRLGQISPITVTRANVLVAGGRRLEAAKFLGWKTIDATVIDTADAAGMDEKLARLEIEVEENIERMDFTGEEFARATKELYRLRNPNFFRRILNALIRFFRNVRNCKEIT